MLIFVNPREELSQSQVKATDRRPRRTGGRHQTPVEIEGATRTRDEKAAAEVAAATVVDAAVTAQVEETNPVAPTTRAEGR